MLVYEIGGRNGLGRALIERLTAEARIVGYLEIRLDVLEEFVQAKQLYQGFGFISADPVSFNPVPGTSFLGLKLGRSRPDLSQRTLRKYNLPKRHLLLRLAPSM